MKRKIIYGHSLELKYLKGEKTMNITRVDYPVKGTKKYQVIHNNKEYTCYLNCYNGNYVCSGNGKSINCTDITDTNLGAEIILECGRI